MDARVSMPAPYEQHAPPIKGDDLRVDLQLDFQTALHGGHEQIEVHQLQSCDVCCGSGVSPQMYGTCAECAGTGRVTEVVSSFLFGRLEQGARCRACGGTGATVEQYCRACGGEGVLEASRRLSIAIPPGVSDGSRLRLRGEGDAGFRGGPPGDLYVFFTGRSLHARRR